ncbi:MAG: bifunctional phosphoglucose/phosphomannose isomerase [Acidimicrobiia bacterium]
MTLDTLGFLEAVRGLPEQLIAAHATAAQVVPTSFDGVEHIRNICVIGMGGSGISGDVLAAVAGPFLNIPITVSKQYELPAFVDSNTLVFVMSYSGGTEETLTAYETAVAAGARRVVVTNGGPLGDHAEHDGALRIPCPDGYMPRAALGALVVPILVTLFRMGLLPQAHGWLEAAQEQLLRRRDQCEPSVEGAANPAREIARKIGRTIPLVYGGGPIGAVAAYRWKCDINENAKAPAFAANYPELDHNEICGWGVHGDVTRQVMSLVELRHDSEHAQVQRRFEATRTIIQEALADVIEVRAEGDGPLAQLLDLMYIGDWVSCYMALDQGVDPGPIDAIMQLKQQLA